MGPQDLLAQLESFQPRARTAFAALCCERLLPNYQAFQVSEQWGDLSRLSASMDTVWNYVLGHIIDETRVLELQAGCKAVAPDTEEYSSLYAELALTTASAVYMVLQTVLDKEAQTAVSVAELALTAVDEYLNRVTQPFLIVHGSNNEFEQWLQKAPMFNIERLMQQENLEIARTISTMSSEQINRARETERARGIQPFLRGLVKERI